jgi:hypothetical protein
MRRCGTAFCVLTVGVLVAALSAGNAFAAKGGQGKSQGQASHGQSGQGNGHAWAKGHEKHVDAAPQLASPPEAGPKPKPAPSQVPSQPEAPAPEREQPKAAPPGAAARHNHVTICHATGSGRYIIISPDVKGVANGHFKHHDDFLFTDGCGRPTQAPPSDPPSGHPKGSPPKAEQPPREPVILVADPTPPPAETPSGELPFTGFPAHYLLLAGLGLVATGLVLRRRKPVS